MIFCALALPLISSVPISNAEEPIQVEAIICQEKYEWDCATMVKISYRESRHIPTATNYDCAPNRVHPLTGLPYICIGLFQIIDTHDPDWIRLLDPWYNTEVAYRLWLQSGYKPWGY